jgi:hypothetical protein
MPVDPVDPATLALLLQAGAAVAGDTVVSEVTRDLYIKAKTKFMELLGGEAGNSLARLEQRPDEAESQTAVASIAARATPDQLNELAPFIIAFRQALAQDVDARRIASERGRIKLELNIKGDIQIARLNNVTGLDVQGRAGGNFSLTDVTMDGKPNQGN